MNKVKLVEMLQFQCKKCSREVRSWIPKSIATQVCVGCREEIVGRKLKAFE